MLIIRNGGAGAGREVLFFRHKLWRLSIQVNDSRREHQASRPTSASRQLCCLPFARYFDNVYLSISFSSGQIERPLGLYQKSPSTKSASTEEENATALTAEYALILSLPARYLPVRIDPPPRFGNALGRRLP